MKQQVNYVESSRVIGGERMAYRYVGTISPRSVVFIHGLGGCAGSWEWIQDYLYGKGISSVAVDLLGFGLSTRPKNHAAYRLENQAKKVENLLQKIGVNQPILIGHCMGGMVAQIMVLDKQPMTKLILMCTVNRMPDYFRILNTGHLMAQTMGTLGNTLPDTHLPGRRDYRPFAHRGDYSLPQKYCDIRYSSLKSYCHSFSWAMELDVVGRSKEIGVPTYIIGGTKDTMFFPKTLRKLYRDIPGSKLSWIQGGNHVMPLGKYREVAEQLRKIIMGEA